MNIQPRRLLLPVAALALLAAALLLPRNGPERPTARRVETPAPPAPKTFLLPPPAPAAAASTPQAKPKPLANPLEKMSMGIAAAPAGGGADFVLRDRIANAFFTSQGVTFGFVGPSTPGGGPSERIATALRWGLEGAAEVKARPEGERPGKVNVFKGDRSTWKQNAPTYSSMVYDDVRPGVDLTVESRPTSLKYTVQAARAADIGDLRFRYAGARQVQVIEGGAAVEVVTPNGRLREDGLAVWQDGPEGRRPVEARYVESGADGVEISLGPVDPELPLTVDPVISWSDYLGGEDGSLGEDFVYGVDADGAGNVYVAGYTYCIDLPAVVPANQMLKGTVDGFLMKLNTVAGTISWATYIGGSSVDYAIAVALDNLGRPVVTGHTTSTDFPFTAGAYDTTPPADGKEDAFVVKFDTAGAPLWGTYLGGPNADYGYAIRVDGAGNIYIGGQTASLNFPIVGGFDGSLGGTSDGFVAKLNAAGTSLLWSTLLGGGDVDVVSGIALDTSGNVYATGTTNSSDFPALGGFRMTYSGNTDAFLSKIAQTAVPPVTPQHLWSMYLGGTSGDVAHGVTVTTDAAQDPVVVGYTNSSSTAGFPLQSPLDGSLGGIDAFVTRVQASGAGLVYSTYLGGTSGTNADYAYAVAAGPNGSVYVTGQTHSPSFPTTAGAYRTTMVGTPDGFVSQLNSAGATLLGSTFLGGSATDVPRAVVANDLGVFVAGFTESTNLPQPTTLLTIDSTLGGKQDGFVTHLAPGLISVTRASYVGGVTSLGDDFGTCVAVDPRNGEVIVAGYTNSLDYTSGPGMDLSLNGFYDAFVTRIRTVGDVPTIIWSTYLGGSGDENAFGLTVDRLGFPYLVGNTTSSNFPLASAAQPPNQGLVFDATFVEREGFLTCLNPDTGTLFYSTYMGGAGADYARAVAVDTNFNAYVTGYTYSTNFPTGSAFDSPGGGVQIPPPPDAFVLSVNVVGLGRWSTYMSGNDHDQGMGIAVNDAGTRVVVTGFTLSADFVTPAIVPAPPHLNGQANAFVAGITGTGGLTWSRYLGGIGNDYGYAVAMDPAVPGGTPGGTSAVVTGFTHSADFPTLNPIDPALSGDNDVFVTRLDPSTGASVWSTYLGGTNFDYGLAVALDASANVYLCGYTLSSDFPLEGAFDSTFSEGVDAFVTKLTASGSLAWSTYLGGSDNDVALGIAVDATGVVYVTGETLSDDFPGALGLKGVRDAFVVRLDNANPDPPNLTAAGTGQFKLDTTTPIAVGAWSRETGFVVKAIISDSDEESVALQVEIKPVNTAFAETSMVQTALFPSGTLVSLNVTFPGAAPQSYHWRARTVDNPTTPVRKSAWVSFGGNLDTPLPAARDIGRDTAVPTPTISSPTSLTTYYTQSSSVVLEGSSTDDASGVASVSWITNGAVSPSPTFGSASGAVPWTTWNIPSIALAPGPNLITVSATDFAGNSGTDQITVHRDNTPPLVSITTPGAIPNPFVTGTNSVNMVGSASDAVSLFRVTWSNDRGGGGTANLALPPSTSWTATVSLVSGLNVITVTAEDSAGNTSTAQRTIHYDATAPMVGITSPLANSATALATVNMSGPASDNVQVSTVTWTNQSMLPPNTGNATVTPTAPPGTYTWSASNVPLVAGPNTIQVTATDGVLLSASTSVTVYRDIANPTVTITLPTPNPTFTTGAATIDLGGGSTDDIGVQSITWTRTAPPGASGDGVLLNPGSTSSTWSIGSIPLISNVDNVITVTVTDRVLRTATDTITVSNSSSAPSVVVSSPSSNPFSTSASSILVSGSAMDNGTVDSLTVTNTTTGQVPAVTVLPNLGVTPITWSSTVNLVDGDNVISIQAQDNGGSTTTVSITVFRDSTKPTVKIMGPTTADDFYTGTPALVLTGTVTDNRPGTTVMWETTAAVGTTPATLLGANGWTTSAIALVAGSQVITVTATDAVGNVATDTLTVVYDPTKPDISITSPSSADTYVTNAATVGLGGSTSDNTLLDGVTWANAATGLSGPATVNGLSWSVASVGLVAGSNVITVIATDAAGNLRTDSITVSYDTAAPSVVIVSPSASPTHATNAATTGLAGTAADDIQVVSVGWVNAANGAFGTAVGTVSWSASVTLVDGNNAITVTVNDAVGGTSTDVITIHFDDNLPSIAIVTPTNQPTHSTTATPIDLAGTASDLTGTGAAVDVTQVTWENLTTGGKGGGALTPGAWSASVPLTSGLNMIVVTAKDAAGNASTDSINVTYDPAAPLVVITTPTTGLSYTTGSTPVVFSGTASDDVGVVSVTWSTTGAVDPNSGPATGPANWSTWSASIPLMAGSNVITITATDGVGRFGTSRVTVVYDPTPPSVIISTPTADTVFLTTTSSIAIGGSATDNIGVQTVSWVNAATGVTSVAQGTGAWSVSSVSLVEGPNLITVTATDGVGKTGQDVLTVIYDGTPPAVAIDTPTAAATYPTDIRPITVGGTVTDNLQINSVTWTNSLGGGGQAVITGTAIAATWSDSIYLFPGDNVITVTAVDAHGFEATDVLTITFTPETGAPGIAINLPSATGTATSALQLVTVSGTADDGVGVVGVTWRNLGTGVRGTAVLTGPATLVNWTADIPLTNGANVIVATAVDDAGNTASATIVVDFQSGPDGVPPAVSVVVPVGDVTTTASPILITLSATDDVGVASVRWTNSGTGGDGTAVPGLGSVWTTSVGLAFGANLITFTARDSAGNTAVDTLIVTFLPAPGDAANPLVIIVTPPTGATVNASGVTLDMAGTASDNVNVATVVWSNPATGETGSAEGLNTWTLTLNLAAGINIITVRAYDTSGNTDTDVITVLYTPPPPPPEDVPAGSCGLLGLDAWLLLVGLAAWRRRRSTSR